MLPYTSTIGVRNGISSVPSALLMTGLTPNAAAAYLTPNQFPLAVNSNISINKDSQWLTLEVCREFQRGFCPRSDLECKYAHPPPYLESVNGRIVCCYDSIKGKCHRVKPPCKYMHPPQHLKDILIQNGKNNLLMKNLQMNMIQQQLTSLTGTTQSTLGLIPANPSFTSECQSLSSTEQLMSTSVNENSSVHYVDVSSHMSPFQDGIPFSTECQTAQCLQNPMTSETQRSVTLITPASLSCGDPLIGKKRSLTQLYQNGYHSDLYLQQHMDEPVPIKRPTLSDAHLQALMMSQDRQLSTLGYVLNPFMAYQNPLASYLTINNPNLSAIMTNASQLASMTPGLICASSPIGSINNLSMMPNFLNQQHLAMMLHAANLQGNRTASEFSTFK